MASRADVVLAQFDTETAAEERKMEKRIEDSKTIRSIDNITAMAQGAQMGHQIGEGVVAMRDGVKDMRSKFKARRQARHAYLGTGKSRKEWRKSDDGKKAFQSLQKQFENDDMDKNALVSMFLEGVNVTKQGVNEKGEIVVTDDKETKTPTNVESYFSFGPGFGARMGAGIAKGISLVGQYFRGNEESK